MIIKSTSYKQKRAFYSVPDYLLRNNSLEPLYTRFITGKKYDPEILSGQFSINEQFRKQRRSNNILLVMDILSFHEQSTHELNNDKLKQIARKYINLRAPKSLCMAVVHQDKSHTHIHILFSATEYRSGKSNRISKADFNAIKLEMERFQKEKFPELVHSEINHQTGPRQKRSINLSQSARQHYRGRILEKQLIKDVLETAYEKALSKEAFYETAREMNLNFYTRNGNITGVVAKRRYRLKTLGYSPEIIELLDQGLPKNKRLEILKAIKNAQENHEKTLYR